MNKDLLKTLRKYGDKYIAYTGNIINILAFGSTIKEVESKLKKKRISDATITYIPPANKSFSPYGSN